jgi:rubrerythrin
MQVRWDVPENFDEEEASSRLLTPYLALAIAVRNEDRAFAFFCYVAAEAADDEIRVLAEELAKEELTHAALLRRERRKVYRDRPRIAEASGHGALPETVHELLRHATELESTATAHHRALADELGRHDPRRANAFAMAATDEAQLVTMLSERLGTPTPEPRVMTSPTPEDGLRILEETFNYYSDVVERSKDEAVVNEAQALAEHAVRRLALVHSEVRAVPTGDW